MNKGYVKLYREWFDHPILNKDNDHWMVWSYLCINATHTEIDMMFSGELITLQAGQLITGRHVISERCRVQESKVKRILTELEKYQLIDRQRSNKNSLITLLNWESAGESDQQNDQLMTSKRPASDQQVTTNKNVKKEKNVKNGKKYICADQSDSRRAEEVFRKVWVLYPNKKGIGSVSDKQKLKLWREVGEEQLIRALDRYKEEHRQKEQSGSFCPPWKNGSTWFNSGYLDYLDENYQPAPADPQPKKSGSGFNNYSENRNYDLDELAFQIMEKEEMNHA